MRKISIIVPVHNSEEYIVDCVNSLLIQTIDDFEIILVNDASTDRSAETMLSIQQKYPDKVIIVDLKKNVCQGGARNAGLEISSGEYVGFVDSDDYVDPLMFELLYSKAKESDYDIVECDYREISDKKRKNKIIHTSDVNGSIEDEERRKILLDISPIWTKIYRREFLLKNNIKFPECLLFEDVPFSIIVSLFIRSRGKISKPLYNYIRRLNSTTMKMNNPRAFDRLLTFQFLLEEVKKRNVFDRFKNEIEYQYIVRSYWVTMLQCMKKFDKINWKFLKIARSDIKKNVYHYRNNKYFKRLPVYIRMLTLFNDIHPVLAVIAYTSIEVGKNIRKKLVAKNSEVVLSDE